MNNPIPRLTNSTSPRAYTRLFNLSLTLVVGSLMLIPASAKQPGYDFLSIGAARYKDAGQNYDGVEASYGWLFADRVTLQTNLSDTSDRVDFQGFSSELEFRSTDIELTYAVNDHWFISAGFQRDTTRFFDTKSSRKSITAGIGYSHKTLTSFFDIVLGVVRGDSQLLEFNNARFEDDGLYVSTFYRNYLTDNVEMEFQVEHYTLDESVTTAYGSVIYKNLLPVDLYTGVSIGDVDGIFAGIRLSFE